MLSWDKKCGWYDWDEYVDASFRDLVITNPSDFSKYPIKYLEDALLGVGKSELVVIGADTGIGKTTLVNDIAFLNAKAGKNVYLFSLEGDRYEVAQRERYKKFIEMVQVSGRKDIDLSYRKFIMHQHGFEMDKEFMELDKLIKQEYENLHVYKREDVLTMDLFAAHLDLIHADAELVIIDHLQYFDFMSQNEHAEITEIMKRIQTLKNKYRLPIILVSHLRKSAKDRIFPDNNDFHGSSNIAKQADTCIILSHVNFDDEDFQHQIGKEIYKTGIRITKARTGISQRLIGVIDFNMKTRKYSENYQLALAMPLGVVPLEEEHYPKWAKKEEKNWGKI